METALKGMQIHKYKPKFDYLVSLLGYTTTIVEIGAHYGEDTLRFLHFFPKSKVYCFEPDPRNIEIFKKWVNNERCKLYPVAVSDSIGSTTFYQSYSENNRLQDKYRYIGEEDYKSLQLGNSGSSSIKKSSRKDLVDSVPITVKTTMLDTWFQIENPQSIDLLWIDVQGAEKEVLAKAEKTLKLTKYIHIECGEKDYEGAMNKQETVELLNNFDFEIVKDYTQNGVGDIIFRNKKHNLGTYFDIGTNIGDFAQLAFNYGYSKVIAVEANSDTYKKTNNRFSDNENIIVLHNACSDKDDEQLEFYEAEIHQISTANKDWLTKEGYRFKNAKINNVVKVNTVTLDSLIERYGMPSLIKIDVEGYEKTVIEGLTQKTPKLYFEWAIEMLDNIVETMIYLQSIGYSKFAIQCWNKGDEGFLEEPMFYSPINKESVINKLKTAKRNYGMIWTK